MEGAEECSVILGQTVMSLEMSMLFGCGDGKWECEVGLIE